MEFVIISGLSGAGKSKTASFLEDAGFYVVDNMPAPLIPRFAAFRRVYALDTRGHGQSPRGDAPFTLVQFARDLLAFLDRGAAEIASTFNLNDFASDVITGIILFCIIASEFFINYRIIFHHRKEAEAQ